MYNKHHSKVSKQKISKKVKNLYENGEIKRYRMTDEGKRRLSEYMKENCPTKRDDVRLKNKLNNIGTKNPNAHIYEFTNPNGLKIEIRGNIKGFCKENNLNYKEIIYVHKGFIGNYKGWKCKKLGKIN